MMKKWIVTTCRDRLSHVQRSIPTWLEHLTGWRVIVVVADDPQSAEYCRSTFADALDVVEIKQGRFFNKLDAIRAGVDHLSRLVAVDVEHDDVGAPEKTGELLALVDLDMLAEPETGALFSTFRTNEITICGWGNGQDLGFICADAYALHEAIHALPRWEGYGPEDIAIRIKIWQLFGLEVRKVPAHWRRIQHGNALRTRHHSVGIEESVRRNTQLIADMLDRCSEKERRILSVSLLRAPKRIGLYRASEVAPQTARSASK